MPVCQNPFTRIQKIIRRKRSNEYPISPLIFLFYQCPHGPKLDRLQVYYRKKKNQIMDIFVTFLIISFFFSVFSSFCIRASASPRIASAVQWHCIGKLLPPLVKVFCEWPQWRPPPVTEILYHHQNRSR